MTVSTHEDNSGKTMIAKEKRKHSNFQFFPTGGEFKSKAVFGLKQRIRIHKWIRMGVASGYRGKVSRLV